MGSLARKLKRRQHRAAVPIRYQQPAAQTHVEFTCCDTCAGAALVDLLADGHPASMGDCQRILTIDLPRVEAVELLFVYGWTLDVERDKACFRVVA
jgi:hypothetical protein